MFRLILLLVAWPTLTAADQASDPASFDYSATFDACTIEPDRPDLVAHCADRIAATYVLKRAVLRATLACGNAPLATCAVPFEDEGLPAIAMQIAVDAGCSLSDDTDGAALHDNHCVTLASDIMVDEGVVPLDTSVSCAPLGDECIALARTHASVWRQAIVSLSDTDFTEMRAQTATRTCQNTTQRAQDNYACRAARFAEIWADLTRKEQDI